MRRDLAAVGIALVGVGVAVSRSPDAGERLSAAVTPSLLAALGLFVVAVGAAVVHSDGPAASERPTPSSEDHLGAEFDATLERVETMSSAELRRSDAPAELRRRLRSAATATVARTAGIDRERAAERVARGTWTDDPVAAAFCSESVRVPVRRRWRERLSTTPRVVLRARRTAAVLEERL